MMFNKIGINMNTSTEHPFGLRPIGHFLVKFATLLSYSLAMLYSMPAFAGHINATGIHPVYHFPAYHDSLANSVPSFKQGVCLHGTIHKGHFSIAELASHEYFFLHLDKPINVMPPVSRDPAFLNPYFHTYDIGLLMSMQSIKLASSVTRSQNKEISLTGEIQIIMMGGGESQPPLSIFLDVSKIGGASKCAL